MVHNISHGRQYCIQAFKKQSHRNSIQFTSVTSSSCCCCYYYYYFCLFCLSPQDVLDQCYFGILFSLDLLIGAKEFQRYLRRICAVPSRTVFCSWPIDILSRPIILKCFLRSLGIAPNDPITTGTTVACFSHSLLFLSLDLGIC